MIIFDKAYTEIKNKYIVPLSEYSIQYRSVKNLNIKEILYSKFISVEKIEKNVYVFRFEQDLLLKGLLGDIFLFYLRQLIQAKDARECTDKDISANWNIVTHYYNFFFSSSLLLRLCFRGNIFLDIDNKHKLERLISRTIGEVISLDSNQFYEVINDDGEFVLKMSKGLDNTHEIVWKKMDLLIEEFLMLCRDNSDEKLLLTTIKKISTELGNTYPSKLRNRVNYQPIYGMKYIENKLYPLNQSHTWLLNLLKYNGCKNDDNQIACIMLAYSEYIQCFCDNLIAEYYEIRGNQNGIIKQFNKKYNDKITVPKIKYSYDI